MLSRTAEALFGMGRDLERVEYAARLFYVHHQLLLENAEEQVESRFWNVLLDHHQESCQHQLLGEALTTQSVLEFVTLDADNPFSMVSCLADARERARSIQDQLSSEVWHYLNRAYLRFRELNATALWEGPSMVFLDIQETCYALHGVISSTMLHDEGWAFYRLGREVTRAARTTRLLATPAFHRVQHEPERLWEVLQCISILKSASAYEAYRKTYHSVLEPVKIVDFLLLHPRFPRSVKFCAHAMNQALKVLVPGSPDGQMNEPQRLVGQLTADLDHATLADIYHEGVVNNLARLEDRLDRVVAAISKTFFQHEAPPVRSYPRPIPQKETSLRDVKSVLSIQHQFQYRYPQPVKNVRTLMRLIPNQRYGRQRLLDLHWTIDPPGDTRHFTDAFGNQVWQIDHPEVGRSINCLVEMRLENHSPYDAEGELLLHGVSPEADPSRVDVLEYTRLTALVDSSEGLVRLASQVKDRHPHPIGMADALMREIHRRLLYSPGRTHVHTTASEAFAMGCGVCQDYTHIMLSLCRIMGLPARYVSGYLPAEGQMHAWVEVLAPDPATGQDLWVAFDPTHNRRCNEQYVTVAVGRDYQDITPTSGFYTGDPNSMLDVKVTARMEGREETEMGLSTYRLAQEAINQ